MAMVPTLSFFPLGILGPKKSTLRERMLRGEFIRNERFVLTEELEIPNTPFIVYRCYFKCIGKGGFLLPGYDEPCKWWMGFCVMEGDKPTPEVVLNDNVTATTEIVKFQG
jgi:hypothetical protein